MSDEAATNIVGLTAQIVSASVSNNPLSNGALPSLIESVYRSLANAAQPRLSFMAALNPAVPVKRSIFPEYIVCLEDGKMMKMLKRHLHTSYGMTPDAYRAKWGLPSYYPMVAPSYAAARSRIAKEIGLGGKVGERTSEPNAGPVVSQIPARRARGSRG